VGYNSVDDTMGLSSFV